MHVHIVLQPMQAATVSPAALVDRTAPRAQRWLSHVAAAPPAPLPSPRARCRKSWPGQRQAPPPSRRRRCCRCWPLPWRQVPGWRCGCAWRQSVACRAAVPPAALLEQTLQPACPPWGSQLRRQRGRPAMSPPLKRMARQPWAASSRAMLLQARAGRVPPERMRCRRQMGKLPAGLREVRWESARPRRWHAPGCPAEATAAWAAG